MMTVGIIGLGLIGGSLARAYKSNADTIIYGYDTNISIKDYALMSGILDDTLTRDKLSLCDLILFAIPPRAVVSFIRKYAADFGTRPLLIDCAGTKRIVCDHVFPLAQQYGFTFIGGHPMAGSHHSGLKYSRADLFEGAPMVLVPPTFNDILLLDRAKTLLAPAGFGQISVTTAADHDRMIAFTSQLAHVVSNAYIQSPTASAHKGFSAGSYQDMTRVAWLDADMWTELFLENGDYLADELETLIALLTKYKKAIDDKDADTLRAVLNNGKQRKKEVDG